MTNETKDLPMPDLLEIGPERMVERAKGRGLVIPLQHYNISVLGASTARPRGIAVDNDKAIPGNVFLGIRSGHLFLFNRLRHPEGLTKS